MRICARREPKPIGGGLCELVLTKGKVALIDEADANLVSQTNWFAGTNGSREIFYAKGRVDGKMVKLHRFLMGFPAFTVDHVNKDTMDNRRCNLRLASIHQQNANQRNRIDGWFKGVKKRLLKDNSVVYLATVAGVYIGTFSSPFDAAHAYDREAIRRFGEFACTNASLGLIDSI